MESWEELKRQLPSDETLKRLEENCKLEELDKEIDLLKAKIARIKEKNANNNEIKEMFDDNNKPKQEEAPKKILS